MNRLSKKEKFCYGLGDMSCNIIFAAISFYLLYYMINVAGLKPILASIVFIIAKFWDAITDYFMGVISDKTKSRFGKRKVYMLFGAIPYGLIFVLLWIAPFNESTTQFVKFLYYTGVYMLFNTIWTVVYVPYNALTANMTQDYDERTSLNGTRIILANVGMILGAALFSLLSEGEGSILAQAFNSVKTGYLVGALIFGCLAAIIMLICALNVKERYSNEDTYQKPFFTTLKEFFKLKEFRNTMMYYLLSMVGFDIIMAVFLFFVNDSLNFGALNDSMLSMIFIAIPLVVAIATAVVWVKLSEKYDKVKVYRFAVIWIVCSLLTCLFLPQINEAQTNQLLCFICLGIVVVAVGFGMSAVQILPYSSLPDVIEVDEYVNHVRREGAYYGVVQFIYKTSSGIAVALVSLILGLFGYVESSGGPWMPQESAASLIAIRVVIGILPGILFILSVYFGFRSNMDRARFNQIKEELEIRRISEANQKKTQSLEK